MGYKFLKKKKKEPNQNKKIHKNKQIHLFSKEMLILFFILFLLVFESQMRAFFSRMNGKDGSPADLAVRPLDLYHSWCESIG